MLVFYLLLIDLIPPISLVIPLLGKYLLFTLVLVNLSIIITIITLNTHFRRHPTTYMTFWLKKILLIYLPKVLLITRPKKSRRYTCLREKLFSIDQSQPLPYRFKDDQKKQMLRLAANHITFIARQIEAVQAEKEVRIFNVVNKTNTFFI